MKRLPNELNPHQSFAGNRSSFSIQSRTKLLVHGACDRDPFKCWIRRTQKPYVGWNSVWAHGDDNLDPGLRDVRWNVRKAAIPTRRIRQGTCRTRLGPRGNWRSFTSRWWRNAAAHQSKRASDGEKIVVTATSQGLLVVLPGSYSRSARSLRLRGESGVVQPCRMLLVGQQGLH